MTKGKIFQYYRSCLKKSKYSTLRNARRAAVLMQMKHPTERRYFSGYKCEFCEFFHVGRAGKYRPPNYPDGWDK